MKLFNWFKKQKSKIVNSDHNLDGHQYNTLVHFGVVDIYLNNKTFYSVTVEGKNKESVDSQGLNYINSNDNFVEFSVLCYNSNTRNIKLNKNKIEKIVYKYKGTKTRQRVV